MLPSTFCLRTTDTKLLREFFGRHDIDLGPDDLSPDADAKAVALKVKEELHLRHRQASQGIDDDLARIEKLASEFGEYALDDHTLTDELAELPSRHARALHAFLHDIAGFRRAEEIVFNDVRRGGRLWTSFPAERNLDLSRDKSAMEKLKVGMRTQFNTMNVHLEVFDRVRPQLPDGTEEGSDRVKLVQITIYRETKANTEFSFVNGELGTEVRRPVLEASVTYEPRTGMIECVAPHRDDRSEIARLLAVKLLGCSPDFQPVPARAYDLSVLKQRVDFATEPVDQIEEVAVEMLKLIPVETTGELITVECRRQSCRDIWTVVEDRLGSDALQGDYTIGQAKIVIRYRAADNKSVRSLAVTITHPNRSNLKERADIERSVANKYLPKWGLIAA